MLYGRLQQKWQRVQKISVLCRISAASTSVFGSHKIWVLLKSRRRLFFFRNPYVWLVPTANWFRSGRFFLSKPAWESSLIFPNRVPRTWLNQLNELSLGLLAVVVAMLPTPKKSPCFSYFLLPLKTKSSLWKAFQKHRHHCNLASKLQKVNRSTKNGAAQGVCFETQISWENPARCQRKKIWILGVTIAIFGA